ncbi:hypothetical protein B5807_04427 [Epicoccum nigrum]|jgi:hypothetical protein|uniref:Uncharacterized protein n=1 Tax=Epicoccum nigrum TaxID=105696 RepID=A0A1Y2M4Z3_EPING|nr:hypothetical protein B5807_04427 [Epicoccum nigrum]
MSSLASSTGREAVPTEPSQATNTSLTQLDRLSEYIALAKQNTTVVLALAYLIILIAALIEDPPTHLLSGYALSAALVGVLCAGSGIWAVLKLEEGEEADVLRWGLNLEDVWGKVWRWVIDHSRESTVQRRALDERESTGLSSARVQDRAVRFKLEGESTMANSPDGGDASKTPGTPSPHPQSSP